MDFMSFLRLVSDHNETLFGILAGAALLTAILILLRSAGQPEKGTPSGGNANLEHIEASLQELLSRPAAGVALGAAGAVAASADSGAVSPEAAAEVAALKAAVAEREKKMQALSVELQKAQQAAESAPAAGANSAASAELQNKIKDLEARLMEYEIIEDDIADLSLYKEENARLKEALEALKSGAGAVPVSEDVAVGGGVADEALQRMQSALGTTPSEEATVVSGDVATQEETETVGLSPDDDVMAEFAAAVQQQRALDLETSSTIGDAEAARSAEALQISQDQQMVDAALAAAMGQAAPAPVPADPQSAVDAIFKAALDVDEAAKSGNTQKAVDSALRATLGDSPASLEDTKPEPEPAPVPVAAAAPAADVAATESTPLDDILGGELNTSKVMEEVQALQEASDEGGEDALTAALDTDKLLMEVDSLSGNTESVEGGDDILSEFMEEEEENS